MAVAAVFYFFSSLFFLKKKINKITTRSVWLRKMEDDASRSLEAFFFALCLSRRGLEPQIASAIVFFSSSFFLRAVKAGLVLRILLLVLKPVSFLFFLFLFSFLFFLPTTIFSIASPPPILPLHRPPPIFSLLCATSNNSVTKILPFLNICSQQRNKKKLPHTFLFVAPTLSVVGGRRLRREGNCSIT